MKKSIYCFVVFVFLFFSTNAQAPDSFWTFGPMFHFYTGKKIKFTFGLEIAKWNMHNSIDFGIEGLGKKRILLYSEYQRGFWSNEFFIMSGVSIGPCIEIRSDSLNYVHLGMQGSCWASWLIGADIRVRWMKDKFTNGPGVFFKMPIVSDLNVSH
jgi:hypothetical protein